MKKKIAVKDIATFLYSSGDLTNEFFSNQSLKDGKHAHTYLQSRYNSDSVKEYYIKYTFEYENNEITVHGFIDGVLNENGNIILEEIKSTRENLDNISLDYHKEHLAQLMLYAYLYANLNELKEVNIRLTYIVVDEYKTKSFDLVKDYNELKDFFEKSIHDYLDWIYILEKNSLLKVESITNVTFPFLHERKGQRELMKASYYTLTHNDILYAIAPTGIGKTMACVFSALKSMQDKNDKLFYLTAKTLGRSVCVDTMNLLYDKGLKLHTIVISSKQKSCLLNESRCKSEKCPYAKGYFNRLREGISDIYNHELLCDFDTIKKYAISHMLCPFEFSLDLSYFCDMVICDYNYAFDPKAHLIRYFEDDAYYPKLLIDEAHNLISRSKDMYSASISSEIFYPLDDIMAPFDKDFLRYLRALFNHLKNYDKLMNESLFYYSKYLDDALINELFRIENRISHVLEEHQEFEKRDLLYEGYFAIRDLVDTASFFNENYLFIIKKHDDEYIIEISCQDASDFIYKTITDHTLGAVFFSATLFPIKYHMDLLTKGVGKYLSLESPFQIDHLDLIIKDDISTKYKDRDKTKEEIAGVINTLVNSKKGNYIAFFPSYKYIELVKPYIHTSAKILIQNQDMNDLDKMNYFNLFKDQNESHLGLFVLGGSFSEGIDFQGDLLNGVVIVGVGLPQVNIENNLLKEFFDEKYQEGFDYAYTYPGFNKIVQAAGRVIRSEEDRGVVILIDERFKYRLYQSLMPSMWRMRKTINPLLKIKFELENFYGDKND